MNSGSVMAIAATLCLLYSPARAHDHYGGVYEYNKPPGQGRLCCGGDEKTGDCEGLMSDQIHESADGVTILSKRYQAKVFIPMARIQWDYPRTQDGMPAFPHDVYAGHWCGKPRSDWPAGGKPTPENPDPNFFTFCAFMLPGGV